MWRKEDYETTVNEQLYTMSRGPPEEIARTALKWIVFQMATALPSFPFVYPIQSCNVTF